MCVESIGWMICHSFDDGAGNINWWQYKLSFIWWCNLRWKWKSHYGHMQFSRSKQEEEWLMVVMNGIIYHIRWSHIYEWGMKCVFVLDVIIYEIMFVFESILFRTQVATERGERLSFGQQGIDCQWIWKIQCSYVISAAVAFTNCHDHQQYCSVLSPVPQQLSSSS